MGQEAEQEPQQDAVEEENAPVISEEIALKIFEVITRQSLEQQNETDAQEDEQSDLLNVLVHNAKMQDQIYFEYQLELKQFQIAVHSLIAANPNFERRIIEKEAEIMDDSV